MRLNTLSANHFTADAEEMLEFKKKSYVLYMSVTGVHYG